MNKNRRRRHQFYYERLKLELAFRRKAKALTIDTEMLTRGRNVRAKTTNASWAHGNRSE